MRPYIPPYRRENPSPPPPQARQENPSPPVTAPPVHMPVVVGQANEDSSGDSNKTPWRDIMMVAALSGVATMLVSRYGGRILDWIEGKGRRKKNAEEGGVVVQQNPKALPPAPEETQPTAVVLAPDIIERFNDFDRRLHMLEGPR